MTFLTKLRSQVQCKRIWHYNIIYTYIRYNTEQNEKNTVLCKYYIYVYYKYALEDNNPRCNDHHLSVGNLNSIRLNETIRRRTLQIVFFLARPPLTAPQRASHHTPQPPTPPTLCCAHLHLYTMYTHYYVYRHTEYVPILTVLLPSFRNHIVIIVFIIIGTRWPMSII